jgi:hypothetical protein
MRIPLAALTVLHNEPRGTLKTTPNGGLQWSHLISRNIKFFGRGHKGTRDGVWYCAG